MRKRLYLSVGSLAAIVAVFASTAGAFVADPTDTATWRAMNTPAVDRAGTVIKAGEWEEFVWRYGNDTAVMDSTRYNALTTAEKAFVDRVRNPATQGWNVNQLTLWQSEEVAAQAKVASGVATSGAKAATTALVKERAIIGLAPKIIAGGSIVFTAAQGADLVERAVVAGENKLFGWHIKLSGPFGIFGSWSASGDSGTSQGTIAISGIKWKPETTQTVCGSNSPCQVWNVLMNSATGATVGTLDNATYKLWVLEPYVVFRNNLGAITSQGYTRDVDNPYGCLAGSGYWSGSGTQSAYCSVNSEQLAYWVSGVFGAINPSNTPAVPSSGGPNGSIMVPAQTGNGLTIGQFVGTRNCTHGLSNECVAYTMTEAQMQKYLGMKNGSKVTQSWAWEKPAGSATTNWQGNIDPDQPATSFTPNLTSTIAAPATDTQRDTIQKGSRDGTTDNDANQKDCYGSGIPQSGVACPDPFNDGFTVPSSCVGISVSACVTELTNAGFDGNHVDTTLARDSAEITLPAGAVVTIDPAGGSTTAPDTVFNLEVNPSPLPIEIPDRLNGNEVATDWETRLRASGYTGTITYVTLDPNAVDTTAGPDAITFPVNDTTTTETRQPGERINPGDSITVYRNPPNVPPVVVDTPGCDCPPLDFTPLTEMGLGSKFPFGIFTYAAGIIGNFNVEPDAPNFALEANATGYNGHNLSGAQYDVDLGGTNMGWLDTYMGYWRDLLSFCMWIGAIWFVGSRLLGFNGSGDPGEGIDEIL